MFVCACISVYVCLGVSSGHLGINASMPARGPVEVTGLSLPASVLCLASPEPWAHQSGWEASAVELHALMGLLDPGSAINFISGLCEKLLAKVPLHLVREKKKGGCLHFSAALQRSFSHHPKEDTAQTVRVWGL